MSIPKVGHVLKGWMKKYTIKIMIKTVVNHIPKEDEQIFTAELNLQPMPAEQINKKPEEQRSWKWWTIFSRVALSLKINDRIYVGSKHFRIMSKTDWELAGYFGYDAVEDFERTGIATT